MCNFRQDQQIIPRITCTITLRSHFIGTGWTTRIVCTQTGSSIWTSHHPYVRICDRSVIVQVILGIICWSCLKLHTFIKHNYSLSTICYFWFISLVSGSFNVFFPPSSFLFWVSQLNFLCFPLFFFWVCDFLHDRFFTFWYITFDLLPFLALLVLPIALSTKFLELCL